MFEEIKPVLESEDTGYDLRGVTYERLRKTSIQWPCPPDSDQDRHPIRYVNDGVSQRLLIREGRQHSEARISPPPLAVRCFFARPHMLPAEMPDDDYPFLLNTGRLAHQWHTMTKTGKVAKLNKLDPGPFVEIHSRRRRPGSASSDQDAIEVASRRGRAVLPAVVTDRVRPGNCFAPFHWNDAFGEYLSINAVTNDAIDPASQQPEFKACAVTMTKVAVNTPETVLAEAALVAPAPADRALSRTDVLAGVLGQTGTPAVVFDPLQQSYLAGLLAALRADADRTAGVPTLPSTAPFDAEKRMWVDGVLAGLYSRISLPDTDGLAFVIESEYWIRARADRGALGIADRKRGRIRC